MDNIREIIKNRHSVRTFDGKALSDEHKKALADYFETTENPFGIKVQFKLLNAERHNLSSPVIVGADDYVAAKTTRVPDYELAYGYSFEAFCLYAASLGLGTVMLAGTLSRKTFEAAMDLAESEIMPLASPIGYPAEKRSMREKLMRKATKADDRLPYDKLFFQDSFDTPLPAQTAGKFADALDMLRLAPSAVNKQPWRVVVCGDAVHFFKKRAKSLSDMSFDIQKIDVGIALAHFDLTLKAQGITGQFLSEPPQLVLPDGVEYVISYKMHNE